MHARLRGSKSLLTLYQIINKPDFPSLADEIAEPHPDMNIKVTAFTVSEKSSNTMHIWQNPFTFSSLLVLGLNDIPLLTLIVKVTVSQMHIGL